MSQFAQLAEMLKQLATQAAQLDRRRGEHHQPLFDERLFHSRARLLVPCVAEAQATYDTIIREQQSDRLTAMRAEHLTEQLTAQITAIQRELSTQKIRKNEIKHSSYYRKPINVLYQELAQHQEWERRLKEMVRDKENALQRAPAMQRQQAQQALVATEQRLLRCQAAKLKIEQQITYREKNQ